MVSILSRLILVSCLFLLGCSSSKISYVLGKPYLTENQNMLIGSVQGLSIVRSQECFEILKDELQSDFNQIQFLPSAEYVLQQQGFTLQDIDSLGQSIDLSKKAADILDTRYYLKIEALSLHKTELITFDPIESNSYVSLLFKIVDLRNLTLSSGFIISVNTISITDRSETSWDFGSLYMLTNKSMRKAGKKIRKGVKTTN